jgi:hypothetical protein
MRRQLSIVALILVLAIASLGIAYGQWTQTLNITGTVNTGTMAVSFTDLVIPTDSYATFVGSGISDDGHTLTINTRNLYPGYSGTFEFKVISTGSIPVRVPAMAFDMTNAPAWLQVEWDDGCPADTQLAATTGSETCKVTISVPTDAGNETQNKSFTFTTNLTANQFNN